LQRSYDLFFVRPILGDRNGIAIALPYVFAQHIVSLDAALNRKWPTVDHSSRKAKGPQLRGLGKETRRPVKVYGMRHINHDGFKFIYLSRVNLAQVFGKKIEAKL
jgi:hypothetical protein